MEPRFITNLSANSSGFSLIIAKLPQNVNWRMCFWSALNFYVLRLFLGPNSSCRSFLTDLTEKSPVSTMNLTILEGHIMKQIDFLGLSPLYIRISYKFQLGSPTLTIGYEGISSSNTSRFFWSW